MAISQYLIANDGYSLGSNINPSIVTKKSPVLTNIPVIVGAPPGVRKVANPPKNR